MRLSSYFSYLLFLIASFLRFRSWLQGANFFFYSPNYDGSAMSLERLFGFSMIPSDADISRAALIMPSYNYDHAVDFDNDQILFFVNPRAFNAYKIKKISSQKVFITADLGVFADALADGFCGLFDYSVILLDKRDRTINIARAKGLDLVSQNWTFRGGQVCDVLTVRTEIPSGTGPESTIKIGSGLRAILWLHSSGSLDFVLGWDQYLSESDDGSIRLDPLISYNRTNVIAQLLWAEKIFFDFLREAPWVSRSSGLFFKYASSYPMFIKFLNFLGLFSKKN